MGFEKWKEVQLKDIATINMGQSPKSEFYNEDSGVPFLQGTRTFNHLYPKIDTYTTKVTKMANEGDLLFSVRAPVGDINLAPVDLCIGRGLASLKSKFDNQQFLYYLLEANRHTFESQSTGTIFSSINKKTLEELRFLIPDEVSQKKIGSFLWSLDRKIETNNNIIINLEQLAQTLFKRWFVDFEFPNEKGEPYKSSGGEMVESELGMIPKGWTVDLLGNISEIQNGFAFKSGDYTDDGIKVLRTLNIHQDGLLIKNIDLKYLPYSFYYDKKYQKQRLEKFDSLLVMVGATIGKLGIVLSNNIPSLQNQNMWRFRAKKKEMSNTLLYFYLKDIVEESINWRSGSAREFFRKDSFSKFRIIMPTDSTLIWGREMFEQIFNEIDNLNSQIQNLQSLRDTLLPKLLSGEIELPDETEVTDDVPIPRRRS